MSSRKCSHAAWFRTHDDEQRRRRRRRQRRHRRRARRQKEGGRRGDSRRASMAGALAGGRGGGAGRRQHLPFSPSSQRRRSLRGLHLCEAYGIIPASGRAKGAREQLEYARSVLCLSLRWDEMRGMRGGRGQRSPLARWVLTPYLGREASRSVPS